MSLVRDGRDVEQFCGVVDLAAEPPDPRLRQLLVDAVKRNRGRMDQIGMYLLVIKDTQGRELHRYADTEDE
jgi:hypothetical protein